jgi:predicted ATP-dependent Lon-type protease
VPSRTSMHGHKNLSAIAPRTSSRFNCGRLTALRADLGSASACFQSIKGGFAVSGGLNLCGSIETIFDPVAVVEITVEKGAASFLMPISCRRQLNDLSDDLVAKITIHYYLDARDALLKALAV